MPRPARHERALALGPAMGVLLAGALLIALPSSTAADTVPSPQGQAETGRSVEIGETKMVDVYVSLGQPQQIVHFHLDPRDGSLNRRETLDVPGTPGAQVAASDGRILYAAMRSIKSVSTLRIDPGNGSLSLLATTPVAENPVYLMLDVPGRHLLMSSYNGNLAAIYRTRGQQGLDPAATSVFETERNPHSIMLDPSGKFGYIPNTGSDSIWQLRYDGEQGLLTPNDPARLATNDGAGPRHFFFHPSLPTVYFVNEKDSTVTSYHLDRVTGRLRTLETLSTLPDDFPRENNTCADIEVTPCGRFLYASNRGHDILAGYAIDTESGRLAPLGTFPTEATPRSFTIDPSGRFLVAAGQGNGRLALYRIDGDSGRLERLESLEVGPDPAWVQMVVRP